ncbi:MAG: hypothetical protein FWH01_00785 [Oscillospiraceae bacterium]|nr:hypothetical protein [Oscillospiraceae bacterium]
MPRGRAKKPESFEDEIAALDKQIDELTEKLKVLKATRKARVKEENENKDANKWEQIRNSGFSADQILDMVNKK